MSISLERVTKRYQGQPVVNDVTLDVGEGEFFVLLGPSGSGKSTLLRAIAGLVGIDHGNIALHGNDVTHVGTRERGVGFVFQHHALFRHLTVAENIEFALRIGRVKAAERRASQVGRAVVEELQFTGAMERLRLRLLDSPAGIAHTSCDPADMRIEATPYAVGTACAAARGRRHGLSRRSPDRLLTLVWGHRGSGDRQLLKQLVHRLRHKIEPNPAAPQLLQTAAVSGYKLAVE